SHHESTKGRKHEKTFHSMRISFVISSFRAFVIGLDGGAEPVLVQNHKRGNIALESSLTHDKLCDRMYRLQRTRNVVPGMRSAETGWITRERRSRGDPGPHGRSRTNRS